VPGAAIGLLTQQLREGEVGPAAFLERRGMVDGGADERVAEEDPGSFLAYETGPVRGCPCLVVRLGKSHGRLLEDPHPGSAGGRRGLPVQQ
jgi:hypothetical protein